MIEGTYVEEKNTTFEQFSKEWIRMYESTGKVKTSTVRVRKHEIGRLMEYFKKIKMKDISRKQYQNALNDLKEKGYADNTLDGVHRTGRMIFKKAVELQIIKNDPTEFAFVPTTQKTVDDLESEQKVPKYLEKEELSLFLETAHKKGLDNDYVVFLTMAYTGLRIGELCALKWSDIDFEEKTVQITKTLYNPKNNIREYQLLTPKTATSNRIVDIDDVILTELNKIKAKQNKVKMRHRDKYHNKDFIFVKTDRKNPGYPLYLKLIRIRMERLLKLADLNTNLTPHSLRHTHTSLLAEAGVDLETIMKRLGHSDDSTTKNIYLHVTKPKRKEASQKFSELMRSL